MTKNTNPTGTNEPIHNSVTSATPMSGVVVSFYVETSILTTRRPTHNPLVDLSPSYMPSLTMPQVSEDFPYGMPIVMMTGL